MAYIEGVGKWSKRSRFYLYEYWMPLFSLSCFMKSEIWGYSIVGHMFLPFLIVFNTRKACENIWPTLYVICGWAILSILKIRREKDLASIHNATHISEIEFIFASCKIKSFEHARFRAHTNAIKIPPGEFYRHFFGPHSLPFYFPTIIFDSSGRSKGLAIARWGMKILSWYE